VFLNILRDQAFTDSKVPHVSSITRVPSHAHRLSQSTRTLLLTTPGQIRIEPEEKAFFEVLIDFIKDLERIDWKFLHALQREGYKCHCLEQVDNLILLLSVELIDPHDFLSLLDHHQEVLLVNVEDAEDAKHLERWQ
jgi:hypothetical protein